MSTRRILIPVILLLASSALAGVKVNFEESVDFTRYQTYAWGKGTPAARGNYQEWIVAAITRELGETGLRPATDEEPDLLVVSVAFAQLEMAIQGGYVHLTNWNFGVITSDAVSSGTGHLAIDLVDAASGDVIWRAVAQETFLDDIPRKKIDKIVKKMFRNYPPG
jgi:hypothetical protein